MAIKKELHAGMMIKDMRERSGRSITVAAQLLGISSSRLKQLEGQADCRMRTLADIAGILGYEIVIRKKKR